MGEQGVRLVRVGTVAGPAWGMIEGEIVRTLEGGPFGASWTPGRELGRLDTLELLVPAQPSKIVCVGRNYVAHAAEHGADVPERPLFFLKPPSALLGPGGTIVTPPESAQVEHEAELAVVIGRRGRRVPEDRAWEHILGVTCGNDVTARDLQRADGQWTRGKGFDTFCPLGPWVTLMGGPEAVADLEIRCRVNGETCQRGRTSMMVFSVAHLVAAASAVFTLEPGDVLLTGTPAGVGPLVAGDRVEVEIEGVGVLANPVAAEES